MSLCNCPSPPFRVPLTFPGQSARGNIFLWVTQRFSRVPKPRMREKARGNIFSSMKKTEGKREREREESSMVWGKGQKGPGQSQGRRVGRVWYLHAWGWGGERVAGKGLPSAVSSRWWLVAQLLRHQLTVPCLCLFVTKDTVLPTYK